MSTLATVYSTLYHELETRWPILAATAVTLLAALVLPGLFRPNPLADVPIIGDGRKNFMNGGGWKLYIDGYNKFKTGVFRITTARKSPVLVLSPNFLPELKKLGDEYVSFNKAIEESMQVKYTGLDADVPSLPHTIKTALTPALVRLNPTISDEVEEAMRLELPQKGSWSEVNINSKLLRIVAMASGRIFVGPELCRDEAYLDAAINYTVDLMTAVHLVAFTPVWLRPIVASFLPQIRKLKTRVQQADDFLRPVVAARRKAAQDPGYQKPDDMLQWIIDSQQKFGEKDDKELAKNQLAVSFAAIHTTTLTTTNAFYTLAAKPEIVPMLREDVQQALAESGGAFTNIAMQNMKKLDSFLKEVVRFYPLSAGSFQRKVLKPFTLSSGQRVPAGVIVEVAQGGVNFDDDIHERAHEFDALRYYKLRMAKGEAGSGARAAEVVANSQFVSVGTSSLTFGYGRHACPGRFFAVNEIKMIVATALLHYDMKNVDGHPERYPNRQIGIQNVPDPSKTIMMRKL